MAINLEPQECVYFIHSLKIGTHKNKAIHSMSFDILVMLMVNAS